MASSLWTWPLIRRERRVPLSILVVKTGSGGMKWPHVIDPQLPWAKRKDSATHYTLSCICESVPPVYPLINWLYIYSCGSHYRWRPNVNWTKWLELVYAAPIPASPAAGALPVSAEPQAFPAGIPVCPVSVDKSFNFSACLHRKR